MSRPKNWLHDPVSDQAGFDVHSVDPSRLAKEVKKDLGVTTRARVVNYKGHHIEIRNDVLQGDFKWSIDGPKFNSPGGSANSLYDAEIKAKSMLDEVIR